MFLELFFSLLLVVSLCLLLILLPFVIRPNRSLFKMSLEKQLSFIEKKYLELVNSAEMFERDEIIERCVCKRNIRRKNSLAASKSARKCIELYHKSRVYAVMSYRIKDFLDFVNNAVTTGQLHQIKDVKPLVSNIEHGLAVMSFDMLDLYLDSFEIDKQKEKHRESVSKIVDSTQKRDCRPSEDNSVTSKSNANKKNRDVKDKLEKEEKPDKKDKKRKSFDSSLKMYKLVPDDDVDRLVYQLSEEVKMEDVAFLFKTTSKR